MNPLAPNRRAFFSRSALALGLVLLASANAWSYRVIGQPEDAYEFLLSEVTLLLVKRKEKVLLIGDSIEDVIDIFNRTNNVVIGRIKCSNQITSSSF